jgi:hypothetical protein
MEGPNGWSLGNDSFPGALRSSTPEVPESNVMNIVRFAAYLIAGFMLGLVVPSFALWLVG